MCNNCPPKIIRRELTKVNENTFQNFEKPPQKSLASIFVPQILKNYYKKLDSVILIYPYKCRITQIINNLQSYKNQEDLLDYCRQQVQLFISNMNYVTSTRIINGKKVVFHEGCVSNGKAYVELFNKIQIDAFYEYANGYNLSNSKINATSPLLLNL
jgi:hypothetical protein